MSTSDDWERWLHLGGLRDPQDFHDDAHDDAHEDAHDDADGQQEAEPGWDAAHQRVDEPVVLDDPWASIDIALTPLTDAQREHLRLAQPTVLDELLDLGRDSDVGDPGSAPDSTGDASDRPDPLLAAFDVFDTIEPDGDTSA